MDVFSRENERIYDDVKKTACLIFVWREVCDEFLFTELTWGNDGSCEIPRIFFPRIAKNADYDKHFQHTNVKNIPQF